MDTKIDNFWTSFGTILELILEPKIHQKMDQKEDPFWTKKSSPGSLWRWVTVVAGGRRWVAGGGPIATGSELIRAKRYRKPIRLLSTGILSTTEYTEYRHTEYYWVTGETPIQAIVKHR